MKKGLGFHTASLLAFLSIFRSAPSLYRSQARLREGWGLCQGMARILCFLAGLILNGENGSYSLLGRGCSQATLLPYPRTGFPHQKDQCLAQGHTASLQRTWSRAQHCLGPALWPWALCPHPIRPRKARFEPRDESILSSAQGSEQKQSDTITHRSPVTRLSTGKASRHSPEPENLEPEDQG